MPVEVAVATLVMALTVSAYDQHAALVYAVIGTQLSTLENWLTLTLVFFVYWLYKAVTRAVQG